MNLTSRILRIVILDLPALDVSRVRSFGFRLRAAFTLIELLVVIAIISVLAGLLLPGLMRARQQAQAVVCLNHVKQLTMAWHFYASDCSDWLSPSETRAGDGALPRWVEGNIHPDLGSIQDATNSALLLRPGPGHLGPYLKVAEVFRCPEDQSRTNVLLSKSGPRRVRSYSMNNSIVFGGSGIGGDLVSGLVYDPAALVRMGDFRAKSPSEFYVFIDSHEQTLTHGMFRIPTTLAPPEFGWTVFWPAGRHGRRCPISFADGHGEIHKWVDRRTAPPTRTRKEIETAGTGPQDHNTDYKWLWDRAWDEGR